MIGGMNLSTSQRLALACGAIFSACQLQVADRSQAILRAPESGL
jgi:hypothetical protein